MDYDIKIYQRMDGETSAPPEFKTISPLGTSPTITDTDGNGRDLALCESNAIIEYLLDKAQAKGIDTKNLRPPAGAPERIDYLFWFHASPASFQAIMNTDSIFRMLPSKTPWPVSSIMKMVHAKVETNYSQPRLKAILELAEAQLSKSNFLAGDFITAADITIIYSFDAAFSRMPELKKTYPACAAWFDRMHDRPAFQAALKKVGQSSISLRV